MATVNPYLTFNGTCEAAFTFYKTVFKSEFQFIGRYKDMPPSDDMHVSQAEEDYIMHVSLPISKETLLMGSDSSETFGQATVIGNNVSLSINANTKEEADRLFNELSADGKVKMPMNSTFWGAYFGMFTDKFGIHWMVNFDEQPKG
jgi:PhnB protein